MPGTQYDGEILYPCILGVLSIKPITCIMKRGTSQTRFDEYFAGGRPLNMMIPKDFTTNIGASLTVLFLFAALALMTSCSKAQNEEPARFALLPASTLVLSIFDDVSVLGQPVNANVFPIPVFDAVLENIGLSFAKAGDGMLIGTSNSAAYLFHNDNPAGLLSRVPKSSGTYLGHEIKEFMTAKEAPDEDHGWLAVIDEKTVAVGGKYAVAEIIDVYEKKSPSLFQAREEMRPILVSYAATKRSVFYFQSSADSEASEKAKIVSRFIFSTPQGQVYRTLVSSRAVVYSQAIADDYCVREAAFQFDSTAAAGIVRFLGSILPYGPDPIQPERTSSEGEGTLTIYRFFFSKGVCDCITLAGDRVPSKVKEQHPVDGTWNLDMQNLTVIGDKPVSAMLSLKGDQGEVDVTYRDSHGKPLKIHYRATITTVLNGYVVDCSGPMPGGTMEETERYLTFLFKRKGPKGFEILAGAGSSAAFASVSGNSAPLGRK
jgi:hypothetical protein